MKKIEPIRYNEGMSVKDIIEAMNSRIEIINNNVEEFNQHIVDLNGELSGIRQNISSLDKRTVRIEEKVDKTWRTLQLHINGDDNNKGIMQILSEIQDKLDNI